MFKSLKTFFKHFFEPLFLTKRTFFYTRGSGKGIIFFTVEIPVRGINFFTAGFSLRVPFFYSRVNQSSHFFKIEFPVRCIIFFTVELPVRGIIFFTVEFLMRSSFFFYKRIPSQRYHFFYSRISSQGYHFFYSWVNFRSEYHFFYSWVSNQRLIFFTKEFPVRGIIFFTVG